MKCIQSIVGGTDEIRRVSDAEAAICVDSGGWKYISKDQFRWVKWGLDPNKVGQKKAESPNELTG